MKIRFLLLPFFLLFSLLSFGQVIYQNDFGDNSDIFTKPFVNVPPVFDANLSSSSWTTSATGFGGLAGNGGGTSESLSLTNSSGTPTMTLTFNVAAGYQLAVTQFNFWRVRSSTGAQNWSMTINGTAVGSGTLPTTGATLGATNVSNAISGLTGTITVVITFSGASGGGTCRIDDFTLIGSVTPTVSVGSDIVSGISPATISSLNTTPTTITTSTQGVEVWQFTIRDGGATLSDTDSLPTILNSITLFQSGGNAVSVWTDAILSCALFDGTTFLANGSVTSTQIIFTGLNVNVADNTQKVLSLRLTLKCPLGLGAKDGDDFGFLVNSINTTFSAAGSPKAVYSVVSTDNFNVINVVATQLAYSLQPTTTGVNNTMDVVVVRATDTCGNLDLNFAGSIALSSTGTMTPVTPVPAVSGVANFTSIIHTAIGTNFTLTASSGSLSIVSNSFNIIAVTSLQPGDIAILAFNANTATGDDEICFVTFVDILPGTRIDITDNSYKKCGSANGWGISEGWIRLERAGSTLPQGSIVCLTVDAGDPFVVSPDPFSWNCTRPQPTGQGFFDLNGTGEQIFFMSNGNVGGPNAVTATVDTGTYSGSFLYGFNTKGNIWTPFCVSGSNGTQNSGKPINFDCFLAWPTAQSDLCKYTGPLTQASQRDWLNRINEPTNWTGYTSNTLYDAGPNFYSASITILPGTPSSSGIWIGSKNTNWFDCGNWQSLRVPDATVDVVVGSNATQSVNIDASAAFASTFGNVANCRDLNISNQSVRIEAATANVLNVNRNLTISGTGTLDMDDGNSVTPDGQLNLYGNWNNTIGNTSFLEGNGTVQFTGTGTQTINNVSPLGTESFYNVILNNNFDTALSNDLVASNNLTVGTSKTLTIDSTNGYVRVNNALTNNGNIFIDNNGQLIQVDENDNNTGDYTSTSTKFQVRRTAQAKNIDYVYWSSPINNFNVSGIPNTNRFTWNPTQNNSNGTQGGWVAASGTMAPGKGYIARASNGAATPTPLPVTFSGGRPNNGQFTFGITRGTYNGPDYDADLSNPNNALTTQYDDNWNLVGNPYPSAIDAEEFLVANQTKIQGSVWIWKHGLTPNSTTSPFYSNFIYNYESSDFIKYNGLGSTEPDTFAGKIASGQGFMVNMLESASASNTILFTNNMRSDASFGMYNNTDFYRIGNTPSTVEEKSRMWLDIINNTSGKIDRTLLGYSSNSTMEVDHFYDCIFTPREISLFSIIEGNPFIIQGRALPFDENDRVPMGINIVETGSHTIAIKKVDGLFNDVEGIYIEDTLLNITHDLKQAPYVFTSNIGTFKDRFIIKYTTLALGNPEIENNESIAINTRNNILTVTSTIEKIDSISVFDVLGRELFTTKGIHVNQFNIENISESNQALIVKIKLDNGKIVTKKTVL